MRAVATSAPPARVVVVDDTGDFRLLLRLLLETSQTFTVVDEAENGADGVEKVRRHRPDVVLLDLAMPVMDGLEALPLILEASPGTQVVVLSGFDAARVADEAMAAGAAAYVQKGAPPEELLRVLAECSGRSRPVIGQQRTRDTGCRQPATRPRRAG